MVKIEIKTLEELCKGEAFVVKSQGQEYCKMAMKERKHNGCNYLASQCKCLYQKYAGADKHKYLN